MAEDIVKRMERWATFSTYKEFVRDCREAAAEIVHLRAKLKTAEAENERLRTALAFYADPYAAGAEAVPDFYSELSFGDTASSALAIKP
jgi:cell shape-determining protein MreC